SASGGSRMSAATRVRTATALIIGATALGAIACSQYPTAPTIATPPVVTTTVTAVTVTGQPLTSASFQLSATAKFADGSWRDVTAESGWDWWNRAVATVSATGLVTIVGSGPVDVLATYQNVVGSMHLVLGQPAVKYTLSGMVREAAPHDRPLAGVRVQVIAG